MLSQLQLREFWRLCTFCSLGKKLKANGMDLVKEQIVITEAIKGIAEGANPRDLEAKLLTS